MIDIIHTLSQFSKLGNDVRNLPRVSRDVVVNGPGSMDEEQTVGDAHLKVAGDASGYKVAGASSVGSGSDHSYPGIKLNGGICLTDKCTSASSQVENAYMILCFIFHLLNQSADLFVKFSLKLL